jgi:choline dehydrogenase-like flavoprotein
LELGLLEPDSSPKFVEKIGCDMIIDARSLANDHTINTDICIVGAGVAGITLARELATWQFRICILESGGLKAEKETQSLYQGENVGHPYYPLDTARGRQFGGSSSRWLLELGEGRIGGRLHPLSQIDFDQRDWVPYSGWPFDKTHLDPYYERAQSVCTAESHPAAGRRPRKNSNLSRCGPRCVRKGL